MGPVSAVSNRASARCSMAAKRSRQTISSHGESGALVSAVLSSSPTANSR